MLLHLDVEIKNKTFLIFNKNSNFDFFKFLILKKKIILKIFFNLVIFEILNKNFIPLLTEYILFLFEIFFLFFFKKIKLE
jgi:hypothetical protein